MKYSVLALSFLLVFTCQLAKSEEDLPNQEQALEWALSFWESLNRQQGEVKLPNDVVTLDIPDEFYYLNPGDSEKVLVEVWGNPAGAGQTTLGMLFPSEVTPFDEGAWAVTIEYQEDGYVSDEDADEIDYQSLLSQMKDETEEASEQRVQHGYPAIQLVGWASAPYYDKQAHKLHWAKELKIGEQSVNTLNYNIRVLGRQGVLILNFIAGMDQKALIDTKIDTVLSLAEFDDGSRYEDFDPSVDEVAAYGLGALVAGKLMAKAGLFAAALMFLKKFGVLFVVAGGALVGKYFKRKKA
ncbi:DUF2167 domain-containing protein [Pseudomonadota bacterium]